MINVPELHVIRQARSRGAAQDLDRGIQLLAKTRRSADQSGDAEPPPATLRIYRPQPTVAFGQRDQKLPGFDNAARACEELGYTPLVRKAGGRAAAYDQGSLIIDHIEHDADPMRASQARFQAFGEMYVEVLERAGVTANLGPIPHEYCYGEHSLHAVHPTEPDRRIKVVGTAQRQTSSGWLFSTVITIDNGAKLRRVLSAAYSELGLEWDPLTAGAIGDYHPGVSVEEIESTLLEVYSEHWSLRDHHEMPQL